MKPSVGDKVKVKTKGQEYEGVYMQSTSGDIEVIKLVNGYNFAIDKTKIIEIKVIGKYKTIQKMESLSTKNLNITKAQVSLKKLNRKL